MRSCTVAPVFLRPGSFCSLCLREAARIDEIRKLGGEPGMGMSSRCLCAFWAVAVTASPQLLAAAPTPDDLEFFERDVRPLLVEHCSECHSGPAADAEGGLSFDNRAEFLTAEGIAVAGSPEASLLVEVVHYDSDLQMPPEGKLDDSAIAVLEEWVRRGLPWPDDGSQAAASSFDIAARKAAHWCWQQPQAATPPDAANADWCRSDIDRFVLARLEAAGLEPAAEATRQQLVRRAAEVLTGLPPDPADVERLAADADPHAFDRYVDQLLASPHYGERFGRHWLDVVRYGETRGHEFDYPIPNAWQYRDWVVRAFNADLPYDQFVREQIAGDLVEQPRLSPSGGDESVLGTAFWLLGEEVHSPVDIRQDEADRMDNRVDTFGKAFLGMALGCARCHDHKFDALSAEDYYAIGGMVKSSSYRQVAFESLPANREVIRRLTEAETTAQAEFRDQLAAIIPAVPSSEPSPSAAADGVQILADYTRGAASTRLMGDPAWEQVAAGDVQLSGSAEDGASPVRLAEGHAKSDAVFSTHTTTGERDPGPLGGVDRAGRLLRTPQVKITSGVLWHRVRGHLQIFAAVDSHVLLQGGPIYGSHAMTVDTGGEWKWVRQDMRKDLDWSDGHTVHVEYAAVAGEAGVAQTVASLEEPSLTLPAGLAEANAALASDSIDWSQEPAAVLIDALRQHAGQRAAILTEARLTSATAPAVLDGNGYDWHVLLKGSSARPGELAERRFLEAIDGDVQPTWPAHSSGRLLLADRVLDPANPLTARVIVNRIWHEIFGRGIVSTLEDFGVKGEPPTHPQLLDSLAVDFMEQGWSLKRLIRQIVLSRTYRQTARVAPETRARDPDNRWLARGPRFRLDAEAIRDNALAIAGLISLEKGGPSIRPPQPKGLWTKVGGEKYRYEVSPGEQQYRRGLYVVLKRGSPYPSFTTFDTTSRMTCLVKRPRSNTPLQALVLLNDQVFAEAALAFAQRILRDTPSTDPSRRLQHAFEIALAREPTADEDAVLLSLLAAEERALSSEPGRAADLLGDTADLVDLQREEARELAAWCAVASAILNLDETITKP